MGNEFCRPMTVCLLIQVFAHILFGSLWTSTQTTCTQNNVTIFFFFFYQYRHINILSKSIDLFEWDLLVKLLYLQWNSPPSSVPHSLLVGASGSGPPLIFSPNKQPGKHHETFKAGRAASSLIHAGKPGDAGKPRLPELRGILRHMCACTLYALLQMLDFGWICSDLVQLCLSLCQRLPQTAFHGRTNLE